MKQSLDITVGTAVPLSLCPIKKLYDFHVLSCTNATMMLKSDPSPGLQVQEQETRK